MKKLITCCILCILACTAFAQEADTTSLAVDTLSSKTLTKKELRRQKVAKRNFHYNILGGPSFSPDFGFLVGGSALMTFRMNPKDTTMRRSVLPFAMAFIFKGGLNIMVKPQLFFKNDKFRIFGQFSYKNTQENFYGVGYSTNKNYVRSDTTSQYRYSGIQINPWFLFRIKETDWFVGPQIDLNYDKITSPAKHLVEQEDYKKAGGTENGYKNFSSGLGFLVTYDTRDIPANPYKGLYFDVRGLLYQKWLGSDDNFYRFELDYRQYKSLGERKVIAWTVQTKNVFGKHIPLNKYALSGTPFDLHQKCIRQTYSVEQICPKRHAIRLARVLYGTIPRQEFAFSTGRIPANVQYRPKQLAETDYPPFRIRGMGRRRIHGTESG